MPISPNMNLPIPVPSQTGGPQYALDEQSCFQQIDSHNHTTGQGSPIPVGALVVNSNFSMNSLSITNLKSLQLLDNAVSPGSASVYMKNGDLYWTPGGGGISVQLTIGNAIAGAPGNITNLVPPASATFDGPSSTFIFQSNTNTAAGMDVGPLTIRNTTVSSKGITLNAPNPLPSDYAYTLPNANPTTNSVLVVDNVGVMSYVSTTFLLPSGSIIPFAGTVAPSGWLFCQGQTLDSVANPQYANLFAVIGTTYGGTGAASFNVPDMRRRVPMGAGGSVPAGAPVANNTVGSTGGTETVTLDITQIPSHTHRWFITGAAFPPTTTNAAAATGAAQGIANTGSPVDPNTAGGGLSHSNTQPSLVLNFIIKY